MHSAMRLSPLALTALAIASCSLLPSTTPVFAQDALGNGRALDGGLLAAPGGRFNQQVRPVGVLISSRVGSGLPGSISGLDQAGRELAFSTSPLRQQDILRQRLADSGFSYAGPTTSRSWEQAALRNAGFVPSGASSSRLASDAPSRSSAPLGSTLDDIPQPGEALLARPASDLQEVSPLDSGPLSASPQDGRLLRDLPRFRASPIDGLRRLDGRDRPETSPSLDTRLDDPLASTRREQTPADRTSANPPLPSRLPSVLQLPSSSTPTLARPGAVPLTPSQERALLQSLPRDPSIPMTFSDQRELQLAPRTDAPASTSLSRSPSTARPGELQLTQNSPSPTLADLRDPSRPLSARIETRQETRLNPRQDPRLDPRDQPRQELRFTDENAPGRATGLDPFAGNLTTDAQSRLQALDRPAPATPIEPLVLRPVAGRRGMELAAQALASGKFVSAESLFAAESWKDTRDFAAVLGQVHSAAAAGILASTGLILADAYTREEQLIGYPIEPALLMPSTRVDEIAGRLVDEITKRRDGYAGILLAHLGYVHNRPEWIKQGLASVEESSEARLQMLAPKLRAGWLR